MNEFFIVFREALEAILVVGIVYAILVKSNLKSHLKSLWLGVFSSIVASILVGFLALKLDTRYNQGVYQKLFEAVFMYLTAGFIFYVIFWLSKHVSNKKNLEDKILNQASISATSVFFLAFFSILREGFETAIMLLASFKQSEQFSYIGFSAGLVSASLIGFVLVIQGKKINLRPLFLISTLCLVFISSGMIAYGSHELEEFLVKSKKLSYLGINSEKEIKRPWNIFEPKLKLSSEDNSFFYNFNESKNYYYHLMHDKGQVGSVLKSFVGYNSNPNYPELFLWLLSIILGFKLWIKAYYPQS